MASVDSRATVGDISGGNGRNPDRISRIPGFPEAPLDGRRPPHGVERQTWPDQLQQLDPADLRALLSTLPVIEQAKGLMMGYYGVDADTAFDVLRRWSQNRNIKIRRLSAALTAAAAKPDPEPYGGLRRYLRTAGLD
jgi:hypothetical protein